jgi:hypothetical protein
VRRASGLLDQGGDVGSGRRKGRVNSGWSAWMRSSLSSRMAATTAMNAAGQAKRWIWQGRPWTDLDAVLERCLDHEEWDVTMGAGIVVVVKSYTSHGNRTVVRGAIE